MPARRRIVLYTMVAVVAAMVSFIPTPYSLILPGSAIDIRTLVRIAGHSAPREPYFLTDVTLREAVSPVLLLDAFAPGTRVLKTSEVVPQGVSLAQFDAIMKGAMDESQSISAVVAERAAGLPVSIPKSQVSIFRFEPGSDASRMLRPGDVLRAVNGRPVETTVGVQNALFPVKPGDSVAVTYERRHARRTVRVRTIALKGKARLGVYLRPQFDPPKLAVPVTFKHFSVSGSSGGLMFALEIYRTLHPIAAGRSERIAGTGTLS